MSIAQRTNVVFQPSSLEPTTSSEFSFQKAYQQSIGEDKK